MVGSSIFALQQAALAEQLEKRVYGLQMSKAQAAVDHREFERAAEILDELVPKPGEEDRRGFEWYHLWRSCEHVLRVPTLTSNHSLHAVALSPDRRYLAVGAFSGAVSLHDAKSLRESWTVFFHRSPEKDTGHKDLVTDMVFTRDAKMLITASRDGTLRIWDVDTGETLYKQQLDKRLTLSALAISPEDDVLAVGFSQPDQASREPTHISVFRLLRTNGNVRPGPLFDAPLSNGLFGTVHGIDISPDGELLAACSTSNNIQIWDLNTGQLTRTLEGHYGSVRDIAFSPVHADNLLASASYEGICQ